jgi:mRNA interferase RelE/StbE
MRYEIVIKPTAEKGLDKTPRPLRRRIADALEELRDDPRPEGVAKLAGTEDLWRVRVGDYRIVYEVDDRQATVTILRVAHRKDVYRRG